MFRESPEGRQQTAGSRPFRYNLRVSRNTLMNGPTVFISYSHQDEAWKDQLVRQLQVLELEGAYDIWEDRKIAAGDGWRAEIETAMARARAAVLLISADFLVSGFIRGTEVPRLLLCHHLLDSYSMISLVHYMFHPKDLVFNELYHHHVSMQSHKMGS